MHEYLPEPQSNNNGKDDLIDSPYGDKTKNSMRSNNTLPKTTETISDPDVFSPTRRNAEFIKQNNIKARVEIIQVENEQFKINIFTKKGKNQQKYLVVHDSEDAAFDTGLRAIKNGGTFIALESNDTGDESKNDRFMYSFAGTGERIYQDPNRIFNEKNRYWPVAKKILELCGASSKEMIVVLHNNSNDGDFHLDTISTWPNISILSREDPDAKSMIWISGDTVEPNQALREEINFYKDLNLNIVYEYVPNNQDGDGSLSVYAAKNGIPYRNIEVVAGKRGNKRSELQSREKQTKYVDAIYSYLFLKKTPLFCSTQPPFRNYLMIDGN